MLKGVLDAANVDLKAFKDETYRDVCGASLKPVLDSIEYMKRLGVWVEVTTLIVPGVNDNEDELRGIASFLARLSKDIPWHISSFHADYKLNHYPSTPLDTMKMAYELGRSLGLQYVYAGILGLGQDTYCHLCKKMLIKREGFRIIESHIKGNKCIFCQTRLAGVFSIDS